MAEDWIPIRIGLRHDGAVIAIARELGIDRDLVIGKLARFWSWVSEQTEDGVLPMHVTEDDIDMEVECPGFVRVLSGLDRPWCAKRAESAQLYIPDWETWLSESAKKRARENRRKRRSRAKNRDSGIRKLSGECPANVRQKRPREQKSIYKKKTTSSSPEAQDNVREPDPIWDTVVAIWFPSGVSPTQRTRIGKLVRDFRAKQNCTPDELRIRLARMKRRWPQAAHTAEALEKHWDEFAGQATREANQLLDEVMQGGDP